MYSTVEDARFSHECREIANIRFVDEALEGVMRVLHHHPEIFPLVPEAGNVRMAKTNPYTRGNVSIPKLRIWFIIEGTQVRLLSIKEYPDE